MHDLPFTFLWEDDPAGPGDDGQPDGQVTEQEESGLDPGSSPDDGQDGADKSQPTFDAEKAYSGLRSLLSRLANQVNQLSSQQVRPPATHPGTQQPSRQTGFKLPDQLVQHLGLDDNMSNMLAQSMQQYMEQQLQGTVGPVRDELKSYGYQQEVSQFYQQFPEMRTFRPVIDNIDNAINTGQMKPIEALALAARGLQTDEIVRTAVARAKEDWIKTERAKIIQQIAKGQSISPEDVEADQTRRKKERKAVFGVNKGDVTHLPPDA